MIITRTPFRVSLFGGGTDHPSWYRNNKGNVLSFTIDKYCYISCRILPPFFQYKHRFVYSKIENSNSVDEIIHPAIKGVLKEMNFEKKYGLEIHHDGDLPARSGLGSSSSFTVGLINALYKLNNRKLSKRNLALKAINVEQKIIKETVGSQDQIAASYGGLNHIKFYKKDFKVSKLKIKNDKMRLIENSFLLVFTGFSRISSNLERLKFDTFSNKFQEMNALNDFVYRAKNSIQNDNNLDEIGQMLNESWKIKKSFSKKVTNSKIDEIHDSAIKNGALGCKLLGAGGGGFMLIYANKKHHKKIKNSLKSLIFVPFKISFSGSETLLNYSASQ